jgi:hypothetical protein
MGRTSQEVGVMPKEYITTAQERRNCDEVGLRNRAVRIGWDRIGYVQLATVLQAGTDGAPGHEVAEVDEGQFVDLDRESINRLIRTLRKARDQAFGADA